jgi:hypothetical protein
MDHFRRVNARFMKLRLAENMRTLVEDPQQLADQIVDFLVVENDGAGRFFLAGVGLAVASGCTGFF